nr:actin cytoskeleton-regulatory complex protein sla1 [Quercus suber]
MVFLGVYRAIFDYAPQSEEELAIAEGDLLFVLEKSTVDDWWKCKKKAASDDEDEPEGLVPNNYVEEAKPMYQARALYDYTQQTEEELTFKEETRLDVYDDTDPDWTLVGSNGDFGFAPAIYIEPASASAAPAPLTTTSLPTAASTSTAPRQRELAPPPMPTRPTAATEAIPGEADYPGPGSGYAADPPSHTPAAALADIIGQNGSRSYASPHPPSAPQYTPEESEEEEAPPMPRRPDSQQARISSPPNSARFAPPRSPDPPMISPPPQFARSYDVDQDDAPRSPGGYHLYNIHEMVSHMGRNKKMPTTLGINIVKGLITISPEKSKDGPSKEWTAEKLQHYSIEGKHVFMELVRPSKSVDFHAGAKDTAQEIVAQLGELAGAVRAEGLREVIAASAGTGVAGLKKGKMVYEFVAQSADEPQTNGGRFDE